MAVLAGALLYPSDAPSVANPYLSADGNTVGGIYWPYAVADTVGAGSGPRVSAVNVNVPGKRVLPGVLAGSWFDDFYFRVHVIPATLDLGNLLSVQTRDVDIWNAHLTQQNLAVIDELSTEGITESGLAAGVFEPLQLKTLTLTVDTAGPVVIGAQYTFVFPGESPAVLITGKRVVVFAHPPNWVDPVTESHQWLTDIIVAYAGDEQRVGLRGFPRRGLAYTVTTEDQHQSNRLDTQLLGWQQRLFALPVWTEVQELASTLGAGSVVVPCVTTGYEFAVDDLAILWRAHDQHEAVEVSSVGGSSITLKLATVNTWPAGTRLYPVRLAQLPPRQKLTRFTGRINEGRFEFAMEDNRGFPAIDAGATYQGYRVLEITPNWVEDLDQEFVRKLAALDYNTGRAWWGDESGLANNIKAFNWFLDGRAAIVAFRNWLYAREGALVPFWSESQGDDLTVTATIASGATAIVVRNIGYTNLIKSQNHRRDIVIRSTSGAVYYRRILSSTEIDATSESLVIDASLGVTLTVAEVASVRFLHLHRLEADDVEIDWRTPVDAHSSLALRSLPA